MPDTIKIGMTRFADFCASDPLGQFTKVREVRRQHEQPYALASDFWSRWRDGVQAIHAGQGARDELGELATAAKDNRGDQYASASEGYSRFWGRKTIELVGTPKVTYWKHDRLIVKVNPEWTLRINGAESVVKLHLKARLELTQRVANPLLRLLALNYQTDTRSLALLDVHRGRLWTPTNSTARLDSVLHMQAAAFLVGWDACETHAA